ncbi:MAG: hypothetical protein U5J98_12710 [Halobacteriales archaeon]|nr:hypothetical protein [Halobacteriales archaeon]
MAEASAAVGDALLARTGYAVRSAMDRTDARVVFGGTTLGYLLVYLWGIGHLAPGTGGFGITVVSDVAGRFFRPALGTFSYEPVAIVLIGPLTYLFSLNTVIGLVLAALVGLNLAVTYIVWRQPQACGIGSRSAGTLAGIPALLSGTACCGPVVLIALGIQASGVLLTAFEFLLPIAALLLVGTLLMVGRQVRPDAA